MEEVIELSEVVELILAELPIQSLLFAQGVCRTWRRLIQTSPRLQEALYMRPQQAGASARRAEDFRPNELLAAHFPPFFNRPSPPPRGAEGEDAESEAEAEAAAVQQSGSNEFDLLEMAWDVEDEERAETYERPEASWRRMLVVQPIPAAMPSLQQCRGFLAGSGPTTHKVAAAGRQPEDCLRMEALYAMAVSVLNDDAAGPRDFRLRWRVLEPEPEWQSRISFVTRTYKRRCYMGPPRTVHHLYDRVLIPAPRIQWHEP